jgi:hypothetical protein
MILGAISLLLAGLASFAMLCLFLALVPHLARDGKALEGLLLQWLLIVCIVMPAIATATFGPIWLYEVAFNRPTMQDHRLWLIASGIVVLVLCFLGALQSAVGKRYSSWRSRVA